MPVDDRAGQPARVPERVVIKMRVTRGRLRTRVAEQRTDDLDWHAGGSRGAGERMAEIVQAQIFEAGHLDDPEPGLSQIDQACAWLAAGNDEWVVVLAGERLQNVEGFIIQRNRLDPLVIGLVLEEGEAPVPEIEVVPGQLKDFAPSASGQRQESDGGGLIAIDHAEPLLAVDGIE